MKLQEMFGPGFTKTLEHGTCPDCDTDVDIDPTQGYTIRCENCGEAHNVKDFIAHGAKIQRLNK